MVSKEQVIIWMKKFHSTYGKTPSRDDLIYKDVGFGEKFVRRRFGSWNNAIIKAGLKPNHIYKREKINVYCANCNRKIIKTQFNLKYSKSGNLFCSVKCSVIFNNRHRPKKPQYKQCKCGKQISKRSEYCKQCNPQFVDWSKRTLIHMRKLGVYDFHRHLHAYSKSVFKQSGNKRICLNCGYNKHTDVCHIKSIREFDPSTSMTVVNDISNLVPLCKNCHWELDHGYLDKNKIIKNWDKLRI